MAQLSEEAPELLGAPEGDPAVELFRVGLVAALDFPGTLQRAVGDGPAGDPEVMQMLGEVLAELGAVVVLGPLDGHGEARPDFVVGGGRRPHRVGVVELRTAEGLASSIAAALQRDPGHPVPLQDPGDGRTRDIHLVVPPEEHAQPEGPALPLPADPEDKDLDVGRRPAGIGPGGRDPSGMPARPAWR